MSILDNMKEKYEDMTDTEKLIYNTIVSNTTVFSLKSIGTVADELNISQMSLVRYAKMLGFSGYGQFRKCLQEEEILSSNPSQRLKKMKDSKYFKSVEQLVGEIENIHDNMMHFDEKSFMKVVDKIVHADDIFIIGRNEQYFLAQILSYRLSRINIKSTISDWNTNRLDDQIYMMKGKKALIIFDYYPYSQHIFDSISNIYKDNIDIILVTDYPSCPIQKYADDIFYYPAKTNFFMNSLIGATFWINILITEIVSVLDNKLLEILETREKRKKDVDDYY